MHTIPHAVQDIPLGEGQGTASTDQAGRCQGLQDGVYPLAASSDCS